jgi:type IV pilus assembly protein PilM
MSQKILYSKLFAPPEFLERPFVAVEISPTGLSYLLSKRTEVGLIPEIYGTVPLPAEVISRGEIVKSDPIIKALIDIRKKTKVSFVRLSLPEEKTYIFKTNLPKLEDKEIRDLLDFKIEENVPLTSKEAVFDYDIIPNTKSGRGLDVVVSVAPLKTVEEFQAVFNSAGLTPVFFSPESNNVARSVIRIGNEQVVVVVNIRETSIVLSLVISGVVCQTSSINFGSSTFTDLLAKYFKVSPAEAIKIKNEKLYNDNPDNMEIFSYLINTISAIKDEIFKFISYCNEREDVIGQVDRIILYGRDALIVGLDKYLMTNLNIRVDIANIWANNFDLDNYLPPISKVDSEDLAIVNGLNLL